MKDPIHVDLERTREVQERAARYIRSIRDRTEALEHAMSGHLVGWHGAWPEKAHTYPVAGDIERVTLSKAQAELRTCIDSDTMTGCFELLSRCRVPAEGTYGTVGYSGAAGDDGAMYSHIAKDAVNAMRYFSGGGCVHGQILAAALACGARIGEFERRYSQLGESDPGPATGKAYLELLWPAYEGEPEHMPFLRWVEAKWIKGESPDTQDVDYLDPRSAFIADTCDTVRGFDHGTEKPDRGEGHWPRDLDMENACQEARDAMWELFVEYAKANRHTAYRQLQSVMQACRADEFEKIADAAVGRSND